MILEGIGSLGVLPGGGKQAPLSKVFEQGAYLPPGSS